MTTVHDNAARGARGGGRLLHPRDGEGEDPNDRKPPLSAGGPKSRRRPRPHENARPARGRTGALVSPWSGVSGQPAKVPEVLHLAKIAAARPSSGSGVWTAPAAIAAVGASPTVALAGS